ncbi:MAG TPA: hypothetical protein VFH39_00135 [Candidatus Saccharimonadales bacterium]|nr:hypothetical protein [Candidatus Saccharimonadales bacterium]
MSSVTTFEIFHDIDRGKFPTESVEAAITYIGEIIGEHTILSNRSVRLSSNPSSEYIDMEKIRWPKFSADVNIVLTDRALDKPPEGSDVALLDLTRRITTGVSNPLSKVAVIDTLRTTAEAATVTHEIGHLFNLKLKGITKSTQSPHCALNLCYARKSRTVIHKKRSDNSADLFRAHRSSQETEAFLHRGA